MINDCDLPTTRTRPFEPDPSRLAAEVDVSVVMPCLNERGTLPACIAAAHAGVADLGRPAEIVIADNGSDDGSPAVARMLGARVVPVPQRGYGHALRTGIAAARGAYVVMGDSDDSYDFSTLRPFVERLDAGADLVIGNRFAGDAIPGAMPWLNRWIGNPVLSAIGRLFFRTRVRDFHCGLRAITSAAAARLNLQAPGMELASEMIVKASLLGMRIDEVPVTLRKDGRERPPHLRRWRDGWRHLRLLLLLCPLWLFIVPSLFLLGFGLFGIAALCRGPVQIGAVVFDIHTLQAFCLMVAVGYQSLTFGLFARLFAVRERLRPVEGTAREQIWRSLRVELGLAIGLVLLVAGCFYLAAAISDWRANGFGPLDPRVTMRAMIPGSLLITIGLQTVLGSFLVGLLTIRTGDRSPLHD